MVLVYINLDDLYKEEENIKKDKKEKIKQNPKKNINKNNQ